ncbi:MAG: hypothetical protein O2942_11105 [Proteobacteria bacterium]|nr:hypothetical protein [Pseudomonadota bacterium]
MSTIYKKIDDKTVSIFIPMKIKKRGGAAMVILPNGVRKNDSYNYDQKLINAIAKAYKWQQTLKMDNNLTITELAAREKVGLSYFRKITRLNYLSPYIIVSILEGKQPRNLKLQDFMDKPIPDLWQEQKEMFGFNSS